MNQDKRALRKTIRRQLKGLSVQEQQEESDLMTRAFISLPEWRNSSDVLLFLSMHNEIDTQGLVREAIAEEKRIWAPRLHGEEMEFHLIWDGGVTKASNLSVSQPTTQNNMQELPSIQDLPGLEYNPYGIWEPRNSAPAFTIDHCSGKKSGNRKNNAEKTELCIIVTPGLAFDRSGHRLGRGKGFYDKWLDRFRQSLTSRIILPVGIGFSVQLVEAVPFDEHDIPLPRLIIGGEIIHCAE